MDSLEQRRLRMVHKTSSRLIYQNWQHKMADIGQGHMVYDWDHMPGDVRQAWEEAVSSHIHWLNEELIKSLSDRLSVQTNIRCDRVH